MSMTRISTAILAVSLCSTALGAQEIAFDVPAIAGKTPTQVEASLGVPEQGDPEGRHPRWWYLDQNVEIVFVDGKAEWITLYDMTDIPFARSALRALGLPDREPTFINPRGDLRWNNIPGVKELNVFQAFVHIIVSIDP